MKAFIFITILRISQLLSLANSRRVARFLGRISWQFAHKNRQVALTNISRCFPELSHEEQ
ncbi:MAG TPA: lipid A biosynthesis acyltransferase, partial [Oceanospirillales bacterium]|nr:lipid A biosynthesis acyltransferase [Oceanospirillales bacterium]